LKLLTEVPRLPCSGSRAAVPSAKARFERYEQLSANNAARTRHCPNAVERAYEGRYEVEGTRIEYWDDTGFTADGDFVDANTLHHGGMILRRKPAAS
jgi:hypothetical protein